jgi:hypothetical protein
MNPSVTKVVQPLTEMFYGATSCAVRDPFGHVWVLLSREFGMASPTHGSTVVPANWARCWRAESSRAARLIN